MALSTENPPLERLKRVIVGYALSRLEDRILALVGRLREERTGESDPARMGTLDAQIEAYLHTVQMIREETA